MASTYSTLFLWNQDKKAKYWRTFQHAYGSSAFVSKKSDFIARMPSWACTQQFVSIVNDKLWIEIWFIFKNIDDCVFRICPVMNLRFPSRSGQSINLMMIGENSSKLTKQRCYRTRSSIINLPQSFQFNREFSSDLSIKSVHSSTPRN